MPVIAGSSASCELLLYLGPQEMGARAALANCTSVLCAFVATGSINNNRCVKLDIVQCCIPCVHCICSHDNCKVCLLAYIGQAYSYRSSAFLLTGLKRQSSFDCTNRVLIRVHNTGTSHCVLQSLNLALRPCYAGGSLNRHAA